MGNKIEPDCLKKKGGGAIRTFIWDVKDTKAKMEECVSKDAVAIDIWQDAKGRQRQPAFIQFYFPFSSTLSSHILLPLFHFSS